MMTPLFFILLSSCGLGLVLTPLARRLARHFDLVDHPDGWRKVHRRTTPLGGGLALLLATSLAVAMAGWFSPDLGGRLGEQETSLLGLSLAAVVICAVGLVDDYRGLRGRHKLAGQLLAVGIVMSSGVAIERLRIFDRQLELGLLALPFTAFWLLGAINSLNLLDGMDGLLGSVGAIICLAMAVVAALAGQWATAVVAAALAGALLAFLCYNFPPASIFLGDSGSMLVGLVVGTLAITSSLKGPATVALATPAALLTIPVLDTLAAIVRRKLTGRSIYSTDRGHLHHCLLRSGLSSRRVLLLICILCLLTVVGVLASLALNNELLAVVSALAVVAILITSRLFGHVECLLIKERLLGLWAGYRYGSVNGKAHQLEVQLQGSVNWQDLWLSVIECAVRLNLNTVRFDVNAPAIHEGYHARWDRLDSSQSETLGCWRADFPLLVHGQLVGRLELTGGREHRGLNGTLLGMSKLVDDIETAVSGLMVLGPSAPLREMHLNGHARESDGLRNGIRIKHPEAEGPVPK